MQSNSYNFDASSLIHLWDNYPINNVHFKSLWESLAKNFDNGVFFISDIALKEVKNKIEDKNKIKDFEKEVNITFKPLKKTFKDLLRVKDIKEQLNIEEDNYEKGVGENDLFIIAIAEENNHTLVSEEALQASLPQNKKNYKIPAVCKHIVKIKCINIQTLLIDKIL